MTWTLLLICLCYLIFVMPISIVNMINYETPDPDLHLVCFCIYWLQYRLVSVTSTWYSVGTKPCHCNGKHAEQCSL